MPPHMRVHGDQRNAITLHCDECNNKNKNNKKNLFVIMLPTPKEVYHPSL